MAAYAAVAAVVVLSAALRKLRRVAPSGECKVES
jgi:hypothetical protein